MLPQLGDDCDSERGDTSALGGVCDGWLEFLLALPGLGAAPIAPSLTSSVPVDGDSGGPSPDGGCASITDDVAATTEEVVL